MKDLVVKAVIGIALGFAVTGSQGKKENFAVYYIPLSLSNCMASYTETEIELWHDLTSIFKPRKGESHLVSILEKAEEPCTFAPYDVRLKVISGDKKFLMDQSGCVSSSTGNKSLSKRGVYDLKWYIDERLPSHTMFTYGVARAESVVIDQYRTSGATIRAVDTAWKHLSNFQQDRDYLLENCVVEVNDVGNSVKVDFLIPPSKAGNTWSASPVRAISYWMDKESGRILKREERELPDR
ncbi:MAG: hypothetical protein KF824_06015 [Fimbriimonadaceae bacterium]|nr:MAG: hypothetical protein KF824_06015 [Fimbriimonadaceae bacterium]